MSRKPNSMYRYVTQHPYTRKKYMGGIPPSRITQFNMGNIAGDFDITVTLHVKEKGQIRSTALEAARITCNRTLQKKCGSMGYHLRIRTIPHHVLRENKQATGAGADRISQGMRRSFGTTVGIAARVERDQSVITVRLNKPNFQAAKDALRRAGMKLASPIYIKIDKGAELLN